jgi:hypothetical protein
MQRQNVSSSNIKSIGYDRESQTLEIEFNSGGIYHYFNVPVAIYENLMSASSHGKYLHQNIKDVYQFSEVG